MFATEDSSSIFLDSGLLILTWKKKILAGDRVRFFGAGLYPGPTLRFVSYGSSD